MNAEELMKKIVAFGVDERGIKDRFGENTELYVQCLREFLKEPSFSALRAAIEAEDYEQAFSVAHGLKGLSGNLGVTAFYKSICSLVESLRAKKYECVEAEYREVRLQHHLLREVVSGEETDNHEMAEEQPDHQDETDPGRKTNEELWQLEWMKYRYVLLGAVVTFAMILLLSFFFGRINLIYHENILHESGQRLTEMNNQIKQYIEKEVADDWRVANSVRKNLSDSGNGNDDEAVVKFLQENQQEWDVSDLKLYTESGIIVNASGMTTNGGMASDAVDNAAERGKDLSLVDSEIVCTVPVETTMQYGGSVIVAVSVAQNMKVLLDEMELPEFVDKTRMYFTEENGTVISVISNDEEMPVINVSSAIEGMEIRPLTEGTSAAELYTTSETATFLASNKVISQYVVSVPIVTGADLLRLFFIVPETAINSTMNSFSSQLTLLSILVIGMFGVLIFLAFLLLYRSRKKLFDDALHTRERMFDLLVKKTRTAFAMFSVNAKEPDYSSVNCRDVAGDVLWAIEKDDFGYRMQNRTGVESETICQANSMLRGWDGRSVFKSGYIFNEQAVPPCFFEFQLYPIEDEKTFLGIAQDVTQTYEREEATRTAMVMATRANEAKSSFLSNMSHDIRTPMNAIMNMTNFALENIDQPKKLGGYLHTIHESAKHLLHLINDVLDVSRIESGRVALLSEPFNLKREIERQLDIIRPICEEKEQLLIADFEGLHTEKVCGDSLKFAQVIMNLLGNAVKFTQERGAVRLSATEVPSLRDDMVDVCITIEDNGIGISPDNMERIFDPFCRADDKKVRKIEGTGLGLSICKSYVDAMGGVIRCESEEGEGSVFTVELFFHKVNTEAKTETQVEALGDAPFLGMHCLVAEDNEVNQVIAKTLLERMGFIVDMVEDGCECVNMFIQAPVDSYNVIYMDIQMPVMDGYEAAIAIRESGHPRAAKIPIVAMTANVFAEDIEKARMSGMDAFVGKPIMSFNLIEETNKALNRRQEK